MKIFFPILFLAFAVTGCSDFFEQTVSVELPEHEPALAVTAQFAAGDTTLGVYLSHSQSILDNQPPDSIVNATVQVFKDDQLFATLPFIGYKFYALDLPAPLPAEPSAYVLKISAPGYEPVEAAQVMPVAVPILSTTYEVDGTIDPDGEKADELTVEFQDPAGAENFYILDVLPVQDSVNNGNLYVETYDVLTERYYSSGFMLADDSFDGKKYAWKFSVQVYSWEGEIQQLQVRLRSISKDLYLFLKSSGLSDEADDNPFAEPVIIHGNVEGGFGIFSLEGVSEAFVEI